MGKERQWSRSIPKGEKSWMSNIGCMGGMFHYFDFHRLLFNGGTGHATARTAPNSRTSFCKSNGLEAPRNSLEKEDAKVSSSSAVEDEFFDVPEGIQLVPSFDSLPIKIKKRHNQKQPILEDEDEKRIPQTPETPRTPSLVARLMGIDGMPDPAPSPPVTARQRALTRISKDTSLRDQNKKDERNYGKQKECKREVRQPLRNINCNIRNRDIGSRSLPDSPRVSSARSWDVEHRLSLQINRENSNSNHFHSSVGGEYSLPPSPTHYPMKPRRRYQDENRSPRRQEFAKEIVKQMKESVSNRRATGCEENVAKRTRTTTREIQKKSVIYENHVEKAVETKPLLINAPNKIPELQSKTKLVDQIPNLQTMAKPPRVKPSRPPPPPPVQEGQVGKCNKGGNERFTARFKKPSPSLSPPLAATNGEKHHFPVTMEKIESTQKLLRSPQLKISDESTSYSMQKEVGVSRPPPDQDPEYKYVRSVLHRGGFMCHASQPVKFYSTSLPVDPIVFHQLELDLPVEDWRYHSNPLRYRWNRKLLFHLVQEFLGDLSQDCPNTTNRDIYNAKSHAARKKYSGSGLQLFKKLWTQIQIIPSSNCHYLGDIDALVASDLSTKYTRELTLHPAVADESSDVAVQVEQEILDELIGETAASLCLALFPRQRVVTSDDVRVSQRKRRALKLMDDALY